jgi:pyruvate kinase
MPSTRPDDVPHERPDHPAGASALPDAHELLRRVRTLRAAVHAEAEQTLASWQPRIDRQSFLPSARNLAHYLALRTRDLRPLQAELVPWGLSSLGHAEARVLPNLDAVIATLSAIDDDRAAAAHRPSRADHLDGEHRLIANTDELFGPLEGERRIRIMVTMAPETATDYTAIQGLIARGMDCARINCAHDDASVWEKIAAHVRTAAAEHSRSCRVLMDLSGPRLRIDAVRGPTPERRVQPGEHVRLVRRLPDPPNADTGTGEPDIPFQIACPVVAVFDRLRAGHRVFVDGGKIDMEVETVLPDSAILRVTRTGPKGGKLSPEKGLNFPDTSLAIGALTDEDRTALDFVATHADIIGYSFVQSAGDVAALQHELRARLPMGHALPALIAKIETRRALEALPEIIVQAAGRQPFGIMIARGDLGVELGYERLAEIQEEMLWIAEAAHIPVVWATDVLERLVTKGTPSRAEMTDAAMGQRAECVMLNKGPHVARGVDVLDDILTRMQSHQRKKSEQLRELRVWQ